jgi:arsenite transporter
MHIFLNTITRNLIFFISSSMIAGFLYGAFFSADFLKGLIIPLAFFTIYPMMVGLKVEEVFKGNDFKLQLLTQSLNFCVIPFVAFGIGFVFFSDSPHILLGMLLLGVLPAGGGAISWTGLAKGNVESAIKTVVISSIIGAVLAPFYIRVLAGSSLNIDLFAIANRVIFIVVLPMLFGMLTRKFLLRMNGKKKIMEILPAFSTVGVVCIVFIAMALKAKNITQNPLLFAYMLLPVVLFYFVNFVLSTSIGRFFFGYGDTVSLVYGVSTRNLSVALAVAVNFFEGQGSDAVLIIIVAYIVQVQMAAWYKKAANRICTSKGSSLPVLSKS